MWYSRQELGLSSVGAGCVPTGKIRLQPKQVGEATCLHLGYRLWSFLKLLDERCLINLPVSFWFCCFHFCSVFAVYLPYTLWIWSKTKPSSPITLSPSGPRPAPPRDVHWNQNAVLIWPWAYPRVKLWLSLLEKLYFVNSGFLEGDIHLPPSRTGVALDISVSSCKLFTLSFVQEEEWLIWLVRWWEANSSKASSPRQGG